MAIPAFGPGGLLPLGKHWCDHDDEPVYFGHDATMAEVDERMVSAFPQSTTRATLFNEVRHFREVAQEFFPCFTLFVSGQFVTDIDDPSGVFVVLNTLGVELASLDGQKQWLLDRLFHDHEFKFGANEELVIQTGIARTFPSGHVKFDTGELELILYRREAGFPTADTAAGYVELWECAEGRDDIAAIYRALAEGDQTAAAD